MIIFLCALHCEAKPLIDFYRLQKQQDSEFDCYLGKDRICIVSGMGELNMAEACTWIATSYFDQASAWINVGVAGHTSLDVGSAILANKVDRVEKKRPFYPVPLVSHAFSPTPIISVDRESQNYHPTAAYDMEAYAFFHACSRFSPLELCQSIKIISDNRDHPPLREKTAISNLVAPHLPDIDHYATQLERLADEYDAQSLDPQQLQRFFDLAHFTQTQQSQLHKNLSGLRAFDAALDESYALATQQRGSKAIIATLKTRLQQKSEVL